MIVCPACSHRNPESARLCEACGRSLAGFAYRVCPSCGAVNSARHAFCHRCFAELALGEGERPIPESTLVRPFVPPIVALGEEAIAEAGRAEVVPQAEEPVVRATPVQVAPEAQTSAITQPQAPAEAPPEHPAPAEIEPAPQAAAPEGALPSVQAIAPPPEAVMAQPTGPTEEDVAPQAVAQPPETVIGQPAGPAAEAGVPLEQVAAPGEAQALPAEVAASPLEGLDNLLPLEPAVALPHRPLRRAAQPPSATGDYEAELFQQVAVERAPLQEGAQVVLPRKVQGLSRIGRITLYILVLLAGLSPSFTWGQTSSFVQPRESVLVLACALEELPAGAEVLLSFDYSPTYAGEMDPLALAVVRHLARRSVRMVVMSTKPEGIGLAEAIYRAIAEEFPDYRYGEHYALLGYLPGQEAGLRTLNTALGDAFKVDYVQGRPLGELTVTSGLATLKDFDQIIIFSDDSLAVRRWIEQVQSQNDIAFHALVTSAVEPLLVPYQQSGQLLSLIPAASGAAEYEAASAANPSALVQSDAYAALFLLLLVVAIVTNVIYVSRGERGK